MKAFTIDLAVASLPMRLAAIGFVEVPKFKGNHIFQHRHNHFELQYVINGHCETKIGSSIVQQKEGEVYLLAPGIYHSQKSSTSPFKKMCMIFEVPAPPPSSSKAAKEIFLSLSTADYLRCDAEGMYSALNSIKDIFVNCEERLCGTDELRILTELLILKLIQQICSKDENAPAASASRAQRAYIIDEFFNLNFNRNDGDETLAEMLGVSVRHLNRILKNMYGLNFRDKLKEIRLEVSLDLLAAGKSIAQISEITGYSCPANFSTFIKNATGKTPSELRRENAKHP